MTTPTPAEIADKLSEAARQDVITGKCIHEGNNSCVCNSDNLAEILRAKLLNSNGIAAGAALLNRDAYEVRRLLTNAGDGK